jgi:branched-chain amino acid transport system substrate-binding protein
MADKKKETVQDSISRRDFIKKAGLASAGVVGASILSPVGTPYLFAKTKDTIKVGYCEVTSGLFGSLGGAEITGTKLAVKHINAKGGIMGRPVEVIYLDTQCKAQDAARMAKRLILEEKIIALHGETCTSVTKVLGDVTKQYGILHWDYEVDGASVYQGMHKLSFRFGDDGPTQMRGIAQLAEQRYPDIKRWAVLTPDYGWGHDCLADFQEALAQTTLKNCEIKQILHPFVCADFSTYIQQIIDFKAEGLVSISWAGDMITFLRQQKPYGLYEKMVGFHYGNSVGICKAMGNEMEPMWSGMDLGHPSLPAGKRFNEMYIKETGNWVPEDTVAAYYDSLFILKNAIESAQSIDPVKIAKAMEGMEYDGYAGWVKMRATSHLPIRKTYNLGYMGPVSGAPYWMATDIFTIPYEKVMVTDQEAKEKWKLPIPFKA